MDEDILEDHKKLIQELQGTGEKDKDKENEEDQDVECVQTKVQLWNGDQYQQFQSDYLNQIYPYKLNKKTMCSDSKFIFHFLASSLHYWVQLVQEGQPQNDKIGKRDINVIQQILKTQQCDNWIAYRRWGQNFNKSQQYLKHQQQQQKYLHPKGEIVHTYMRGEEQFQIVKYYGNDKQFFKFKQRMQVLLLFYIDGVSFIFQEFDTWIYYIVFKKIKNSERKLFVGMLSKYIFRLSTVKQRHRISQVFILPSYQKSGHGKELIDVVYASSLKDNKCFQITTQIPSFQYQCLRDYKELQMIIKSNILNINTQQVLKMKIQQDFDINRSKLMTKQNIRKIKEMFKIPGHQIQRLVNIIIFYFIQKSNDDMAKSHFEQDIRDKIITNRSPFKTRKRLPHLTMNGKVPQMKQFMLQKAKEDMLRNQEQVLQIQIETMNGFKRVIDKAIRSKLLS